MDRTTVLLLVVALAAALVASTTNANPVVPVPYPLFRQCDPVWGGDLMGGGATICQQGCAITSVAMALNGRGYKLGGQDITPKTLNQWLINNKGYICINNNCNNLRLNAIEQISKDIFLWGELPIPAYEDVIDALHGRFVFAAHVRNNSHFVLLTGFDDEKAGIFFANDPYYNTTTYPYDDITDVILYRV